jgi:hypothetical protein
MRTFDPTPLGRSINAGSENERIVSLADYRRKRFGTSDDGAPPPGPGALAARPLALSPSLEAIASRSLASAKGNAKRIAINGN